MKQGALIFDERSDRYDIRFDLADYYGGLHCGETFDVMAKVFVLDVVHDDLTINLYGAL